MHSHTLPRTKLCLSALLLLVLTGILSLNAQAQRAINDADRVTLHGNTHALARAEFDRGSAPASMPRAWTGLVKGIVSMNNFEKHPNSTATQLPPDFNNGVGGQHFPAPGDFSIIYNVFPLYNQAPAIDGTGQAIAIVGRTDINLADVQYFRSFFGLPPNDPVFIHNGADPGNLGGNEETEADLDVEWAGAIAKKATVFFVISQTTSTDGVDLSAQYIVNNNVAPVMSTSFGQCEFNLPASENAFWNSLWTQAATQGITAFVSAGDSGAAGCDLSGAASGTQQGING